MRAVASNGATDELGSGGRHEPVVAGLQVSS